MAYQSRARKRVHAIRRGPDGSAFQKCESCGQTVAIALFDMHECGFKKNKKKKLKTQCGNRNVERQGIQDQPRSAFHLFMDEFVKTCTDGNEIEIDKKGCEKWKNMSREERQPFVLQADKLNSAYVKLLLEEENEIQRVDDEADSAEVGKLDENYEDYEMCFYDSESSGGFGLFLSETYDTFGH
ncbi:HMG box-containing protein [Handroanthus impetiginosus]|uniref:HMG box-containing protein n=1 Tax=Handroanthus impetiginosus TaxID=429701 RepID=A0A2G9HSI7_9LAMI|nr:HMG box-containing protein [Handroanthus impetiginosus]